MAVDLNMDMNDLIQMFMKKYREISSSGTGASASAGTNAGEFSIAPYKIAIIIFTVILVISIGYIAIVYMPLKAQNNKKMEELAKVLEMKNQLSVLDGQVAMLKKKLDKSKEQYLESLAHFGNSEDLGGLYQTVSTLSAKYGLVVLNVKEIASPPAVKPKASTGKDATAKPAKPTLEVKEIKVDVELKGSYGEYIKFKEDLALAEILLKINSESIMVKDDKAEQGYIYVKLNLSTYAIDKKPFQGIISEK